MTVDIDAVREVLARRNAARSRTKRYRTPRTSYHTAAQERGAGKQDAAALARILSSLVDPVTGCWEWQGAKTIGYGRIKINGRLDMAHRVAYRLFVGPLLPGLCVDHQCANKGCVNPDHLEQVTYSVNMRRAHLVSDATAKRGVA